MGSSVMESQSLGSLWAVNSTSSGFFLSLFPSSIPTLRFFISMCYDTQGLDSAWVADTRTLIIFYALCPTCLPSPSFPGD